MRDFRHKTRHFVPGCGHKRSSSRSTGPDLSRKEEVKALVARRDDTDPASVHNSGSIYLTYACPQAAKTTLWILQPKGLAGNDRFVPFAV